MNGMGSMPYFCLDKVRISVCIWRLLLHDLIQQILVGNFNLSRPKLLGFTTAHLSDNILLANAFWKSNILLDKIANLIQIFGQHSTIIGVSLQLVQGFLEFFLGLELGSLELCCFLFTLFKLICGICQESGTLGSGFSIDLGIHGALLITGPQKILNFIKVNFILGMSRGYCSCQY